MAQLGHWHWPVPVLFQELGVIPFTWMKDEPRGKGAAQGEQDGAAGSQSGLCWALRGAEVAAGGCFSLVFPGSPHHCHSLIVAMLSVPAVSGIAGGRRKEEHP